MEIKKWQMRQTRFASVFKVVDPPNFPLLLNDVTTVTGEFISGTLIGMKVDRSPATDGLHLKYDLKKIVATEMTDTIIVLFQKRLDSAEVGIFLFKKCGRQKIDNYLLVQLTPVPGTSFFF